jgi:hypothetical protein
MTHNNNNNNNNDYIYTVNNTASEEGSSSNKESIDMSIRTYKYMKKQSLCSAYFVPACLSDCRAGAKVGVTGILGQELSFIVLVT